MLQVAATILEQFRQVVDGDLEEVTFLERLKGQAPVNKFAELGKAFHDIIQDPQKAYSRHEKAFETPGFLSKDGIVFPYQSITEFYTLMDYRFPFEIEAEKLYTAKNRDILVTARADQLIARAVVEIKSTWGVFDYDKYRFSLQWPLYLDIFEAEMVQYKVAVFNETPDGISIVSSHKFYFTHDDYYHGRIAELLELFVEYLENKKLFELFTKKENNENYKYKNFELSRN